MTPFETVDHTADLALVVRGNTLAELFENAASGMVSQVADLSRQRPVEERRRWELTGDDPEDLLIAWLRELLFLQETEECVFRDFEVRLDGPRLMASAHKGPLLAGEPLTDLKAVTYHDLRVEQVGDHWQTKVVFDL